MLLGWEYANINNRNGNRSVLMIVKHIVFVGKNGDWRPVQAGCPGAPHTPLVFRLGLNSWQAEQAEGPHLCECKLYVMLCVCVCSATDK